MRVSVPLCKPDCKWEKVRPSTILVFLYDNDILNLLIIYYFLFFIFTYYLFIIL